MKEETIKSRRYSFTEEEFKEKLGLEGKITFLHRDSDLSYRPKNPTMISITTEEEIK